MCSQINQSQDEYCAVRVEVWCENGQPKASWYVIGSPSAEKPCKSVGESIKGVKLYSRAFKPFPKSATENRVNQNKRASYGTTSSSRVTAYRTHERDDASFSIPPNSRVEILGERPHNSFMSVRVRHQGRTGWVIDYNVEY